MKTLNKLTIFLLLFGLAACAGLVGPPPAPGEARTAVEAKMGRPSAVYQLGDSTELEYATGPYGQFTYMAKFGPDNRLTSFEQVLTGEKFATIKVGLARQQDVLRTLGRPAEKSYLALPKLHVWSYRYKESGVWDSMMHVHFDDDGVVRMMMNGPDPDKEERRFFR